MHSHDNTGRRTLTHPARWLLAVLLVLAGCATPLSVEDLDTHQGYNLLNRSALGTDKLSESTLTTLRRHGLKEGWDNYPDATIAALRSEVVGQPAAWPDLFALAELSFFQGDRNNSKPDFLAAAVYAYAFLFPGEGGERPSPYDPRFRQACDIYNLGLTAAFTPPGGGLVQLASGRRALPAGAIDLEVNQDQLRWGDRTLVSFQPTSNLAVEGMQNIYRNPGLGAPLAALTEASASTTGFQVAPKLRVPTNMLLTMTAPRRQLAGPVLQGRLLINTIYDVAKVRIGQENVPLEYNQTAARALSLVQSSAWGNEYSGFLDGGLFEQAPTQLAALQPHQKGRMPVILIHGTASSPFRWADMVNDLLEDPAIRDHFEFWFFSYATGNPIPYSALQLRRSIEQAVQQLGGTAADPALGEITLIGHSQGGLLAKMLVVDPGDKMWASLSNRQFDSLKLTDSSRSLLHDAIFPRPLPEVQRVIFVATPQHGSYVAAFSISRLVGQLVTLPLTVAQATGELLTGNDNILADPTQTRIGSIYGMSPNSPFIKALASTPVAPGVHAHSIIPVLGDEPLPDGGDGVVRYSSAHIDDADSERVVRHSSHSTQANPVTIAEVQRILLLQLAASGGVGQRPVAMLPGR
jgi:pimeloyl-ACP methyl ester carboxylesterase